MRSAQCRSADSPCVLLFRLNRLRTEPGSADSNAFEVLFYLRRHWLIGCAAPRICDDFLVRERPLALWARNTSERCGGRSPLSFGEGVRYWLVKYDSAKKEILTPHEPPVVSYLDLIVLRSQLKQNTPGLREGFLVNTLRFSTAIVTWMHHNSMKMKVTL